MVSAGITAPAPRPSICGAEQIKKYKTGYEEEDTAHQAQGVSGAKA